MENVEIQASKFVPLVTAKPDIQISEHPLVRVLYTFYSEYDFGKNYRIVLDGTDIAGLNSLTTLTSYGITIGSSKGFNGYTKVFFIMKYTLDPDELRKQYNEFRDRLGIDDIPPSMVVIDDYRFTSYNEIEQCTKLVKEVFGDGCSLANADRELQARFNEDKEIQTIFTELKGMRSLNITSYVERIDKALDKGDAREVLKELDEFILNTDKTTIVVSFYRNSELSAKVLAYVHLYLGRRIHSGRAEDNHILSALSSAYYDISYPLLNRWTFLKRLPNYSMRYVKDQDTGGLIHFYTVKRSISSKVQIEFVNFDTFKSKSKFRMQVEYLDLNDIQLIDCIKLFQLDKIVSESHQLFHTKNKELSKYFDRLEKNTTVRGTLITTLTNFVMFKKDGILFVGRVLDDSKLTLTANYYAFDDAGINSAFVKTVRDDISLMYPVSLITDFDPTFYKLILSSRVTEDNQKKLGQLNFFIKPMVSKEAFIASNFKPRVDCPKFLSGLSIFDYAHVCEERVLSIFLKDFINEREFNLAALRKYNELMLSVFGFPLKEFIYGSTLTINEDCWRKM